MRQIINLPPKLKELVSKVSEIWKYPESVIIAYCVSFTLMQERLSNYDGFSDELDEYYQYHIKSLPRGKKSRSK